jgi:hypothetical protein
MTTQEPGPGSQTGENSPPRSRLESEVLEILERSEQPIPFHQRVRRITWRRRRARLEDFLATPFRYLAGLGSRSILIAAGVAAVLALFLNGSSPVIGRIAAIAFIVLIGVFFFAGHRRSPRGSSVKRWRGEDVDFGSSRGPDDDSGSFRPPWRR